MRVQLKTSPTKETRLTTLFNAKVNKRRKSKVSIQYLNSHMKNRDIRLIHRINKMQEDVERLFGKY